jgi:two-component system OmpR family response regulator
VRLLVVDDERELALTLADGLEAEGFSVDIAADGVQALFHTDVHTYDLILLDLMLPGRNGYQVCSDLRERGNHTPILMLTAKDGEHDEADALDLGADDYLTKPFSFVVLLARIRSLLRRRQGDPIPVLTAGPLRLDPASRRCWCGEVEVELTAREFSLMEFLVRRKEEVLSKTEIVHHVWDAHFDGDLNVVEVYIGHLRRKIDQPFGRRAIQTLRGAGYRLVSEEG